MNPSAKATKTLIYPGAGWDESFHEYFSLKGYGKFILYDSLPKVKHYEKEHFGFPQQEDFFGTLRKVFGEYRQSRKRNCLYFPDKNITYYYSIDADNICPPDGDILFRGYYPESWQSKGYLEDKIIYLSDDTYFGAEIDRSVIKYEKVPFRDE